MTALVAALGRRSRRDGARPLITYYDLGSGARMVTLTTHNGPVSVKEGD